jgi:4'-phosphopantetheinyl transferase
MPTQPNRHETHFAAGTLPTERVDVWRVSLAVGPEQIAKFWEWLSADERARADRFKFERDRRRFVAGRGALRSILSAYVCASPGVIRFDYGPHGKPLLAESTSDGRIEFNASGSDELGVCAVTIGGPVGVDIELRKPLGDEAFGAECLSPAEAQAYQALAPAKRPAAFYRLWTLKEAYLKATGCGLSRPLSTLEVAFLPSEPARLVADHDAPGAETSWSFVEFSPGPAHAGALALAGSNRPVWHRAWSPQD